VTDDAYSSAALVDELKRTNPKARLWEACAARA